MNTVRCFQCLLMCVLGWTLMLPGALGDNQFFVQGRVYPGEPAYPLDVTPQPLRPHSIGVFHDLSIVSDGFERSFRVVVPETYYPARPIGILFGFQGAGQPNMNYLWSAGFEDFAEEAYWICVSMTVQSRPGDASSGWAWDNPDETTNGDLKFFRLVYDELRSLYNIDPDRIYGSGYSNGSLFLDLISSVYPTLFASINLNMGPDWTQPTLVRLRPESRQTCIISGGLVDYQYNSAGYLRRVTQRYREAGLTVAPYIFDCAHRYPPPMQSTDPSKFWTDTVVEFFLEQTPGVRHLASRPAAEGIAEDFSGASGRPDGTLWEVNRINEEGILGQVATSDCVQDSGHLVIKSWGSQPSATICWTEHIIPTTGEWVVEFEWDPQSEAAEIFPAVFKMADDSICFLTIDADGWQWRSCATAMDFYADPERSKLLLRVATPLNPAQPRRLKLRLGDQLYSELTAAEAAQSSAISFEELGGIPIRFGFGMRGARSSARFDQVRLITPEQTIQAGRQAEMIGEFFDAFALM